MATDMEDGAVPMDLESPEDEASMMVDAPAAAASTFSAPPPPAPAAAHTAHHQQYQPPQAHVAAQSRYTPPTVPPVAQNHYAPSTVTASAPPPQPPKHPGPPPTAPTSFKPSVSAPSGQRGPSSSHAKPPHAPGRPPAGAPAVVVRPSEREYAPDIICRVKYRNTLPDLPFDPKLLLYPFDPMRYIRYRTSTVEREHKFDLHSDSNVIVSIDLVDPDTYRPPRGVQLHEVDASLVEDEKQEGAKNKDRAAAHALQVNFLRKAEYLSAASDIRVYGGGADAEAVRQRQLMRQKAQQKQDRESQVAAVEKTFKAAISGVIKHPTKRNLRPVEVMPVFPDTTLWKNVYSQVVFDGNPAPRNLYPPDEKSGPAWDKYQKELAEQQEQMSMGMLQGMTDPATDEKFVGYFLPTKQTVAKRKAEDDEAGTSESLEYNMVRSYNWKVKTTMEEDTANVYFFTLRDGQCVYNELPHVVYLKKRRKKEEGKHRTETQATLTLREPTEDEDRTGARRLRILETGVYEPPILSSQRKGNRAEERDVEEEEDEERDVDVNGRSRSRSASPKSDREEDEDEDEAPKKRAAAEDLFEDSD